MAEYIERKALLELINEDCKYQNPTNEYTRGCNEVCDWAIKTIKNIPTADVVPKSEVDFYRKQVDELEDELASTYDKLENARAEAAKEIFEEIEKYWIKSDTLPDCARLVDLDKIAELKKKYTGE